MTRKWLSAYVLAFAALFVAMFILAWIFSDPNAIF
jgi:hypothetical protein